MYTWINKVPSSIRYLPQFRSTTALWYASRPSKERTKLFDVYEFQQRSYLPIQMWTWSLLLQVLYKASSWEGGVVSTVRQTWSFWRKSAYWAHDMDYQTGFTPGVRGLWSYHHVFHVSWRNSRYFEIYSVIFSLGVVYLGSVQVIKCRPCECSSSPSVYMNAHRPKTKGLQRVWLWRVRVWRAATNEKMTSLENKGSLLKP